MLKELKLKLDEAKDDLADESYCSETLAIIHTIETQIKKEHKVGRRGGSRTWPVHIVLLICELLVSGTPPSAVPLVIQTTQYTMSGDNKAEVLRP